jgi:UPF0755 protein
VLELLERRGAIDGARALELHLRLRGHKLNVKAGEYQIPPRASPADIVAQLESGRVVLEQLTVVEGSTFADLRRSLERHPQVKLTLKGKSDREVMAVLGFAEQHPEGRFFPDTYRFAGGTSDRELLSLAHRRMAAVLEDAWRQRAADLPLRTADEALILASIVEKETGLASERPRIAGVFTTRLRKGMRLQSDPTVIYGIGPGYDGDIRTRDLSTDNPYNTYTRGGLPPTPVALPGRDSLLAAVRPEETGDIYFVAVGDGSGAHQFSRTLEEHNAAVQRYLQRTRAAQREAARQASEAAAEP